MLQAAVDPAFLLLAGLELAPGGYSCGLGMRDCLCHLTEKVKAGDLARAISETDKTIKPDRAARSAAFRTHLVNSVIQQGTRCRGAGSRKVSRGSWSCVCEVLNPVWSGRVGAK